MEATTFKSSVFGGFRRKDVINYIEKSALEANQRIDSLEKDTDGLTTENRTLRDRIAALDGEHDRLNAALRDADEARVRLNTELDALRAERDALLAERDALRREVEALRPQAEEFAAVKANLAEMELAARRRAEAYDAEVRDNADAYKCETCKAADTYRRETREAADAYRRETCEAVDALLDGVRAQCDGILATLVDTCQNVTQRLDENRESIARLPAAFHTLRHDLEDLGGAKG